MKKKKRMSDEDFWKSIIDDQEIRQNVTRKNFLAFWTVYYASNLTKQYELANFQKEIIAILQNYENKFLVLEGFRGSSKTSIANVVYTVWSIVGMHQVKSVLIICQTQEQAKQCLNNIKSFMQKEPLRSDMGPFQIPEGEWRSNAVDIPKYGARIVVASIDQPIRGMLHDMFRPQVIICDDLENSRAGRSSELRAKLHETFASDIIPIGDVGSRFTIIGTRFHEDSLIMRLKNQIEQGKRDGIFRSYPIIDGNKKILWPSKFPTMKEIDAEKRKVSNNRIWRREYLLQLIPDGEEIVKKEWIHYYDRMPSFDSLDYVGTYIAVDPAIKTGKRNAYTAMVTASVFGEGDKRKIYIHREYINEKIRFNATIKKVKGLSGVVANGKPVKVIVEDVAYQASLIEDLRKDAVDVEPVLVGGMDKDSRLISATGPMENEQVLFPKPPSCEEIVDQILNFKSSDHKDLADAFSMIVRKCMGVFKPCDPEICFY